MTAFPPENPCAADNVPPNKFNAQAQRCRAWGGSQVLPDRRFALHVELQGRADRMERTGRKLHPDVGAYGEIHLRF